MIKGKNIKPISDLNQYPEVLKDVEVGSPVFLTKNGHGKYVIFDIDDPIVETFEEVTLSKEVIEQIKKIEKESDKKGWLTLDDVKKALTASFDWLKH